MHNLTIDIGNTSSKLAVFRDKEVVHYQRLPKIHERDLARLIEKYKVHRSIISSVDEDIMPFENFLKGHTNYTRFTTSLSNGIENRYKTPDTLGLDRWAAVLAAKGLYPGISCLTIDAGTCITYDLLNKKGQYYGGSISLGIHMRFAALHHYTGRLPLVEWEETEAIPEGMDTLTAIKNGVLQGVINEIEGFIAIHNKKEKGLQIIFTGGDAKFLVQRLGSSIFAPQIIIDPYWVLRGLNEVVAF